MILALLLAACGRDAAAPPPHSDPPADTDTASAADTGDTDTAGAGPRVILSELVSDNHSGLTDGDGDTSDWVELYNPSAEPVDLEGWTLLDGEGVAYTFGEETLLGGAWLVVFASGKGAGGPSGERHAPFRLDREGESVLLLRPDRTVSDAVALPALPEDVSWGPEQPTTTWEALGDGSPARVWVGAAPGWTAPGFDDAAWAAATLPVGFDRSAEGATPQNAALGRSTAQSSDGYGRTGAQAVDGDPLTFSHTGDGDLAPTLTVDLDGDTRISAITLFNRTDCCAERLYNLVVTVLDSAGGVVWRSEVLNPVAAGETPVSPGTVLALPVEPPVIGTQVQISKTALSSPRSEWLSLAELVVDGQASAPYAAWIQTELSGAPALVRAPLAVDSAPSSATLELAWDDGFEAWLDGAPVAASGAGVVRATAPHSGSQTADFALDPRTLTPGTHLLALRGLNAPGDGADLLLRPRLLLHTVTTGDPAYYTTPTPGGPNGEGAAGLLEEPALSPPRGFYDAPFTATLRASTPGATLIYTLDGRTPSREQGVQVPAPGPGERAEVALSIQTTTLVRAMEVQEGWFDSEVATHTLLFLEDVLAQPAAPAGWPTVWDGLSEAPYAADYEMDPELVDPDPAALIDALLSLPTLSIVTDQEHLFGPEGLYENSAERGASWERPTSVELLLPDGGEGFQEDCGLRIHGYGWRYHSATLKHSFRLEFSRDYGAPKLEYPLFADAPVDRFDSIVLRAGGSKTWLDFRDPAQAQYLHDAFARDTARDMGKLDGHATYVHLYLNGLYWGLYNAVERPDADFAAAYLGGEAEEYDAINRRTVTNEAIDGTLEAYNTLLALADADLSTDEGLAQVEAMLNLDDLIDYMLIHQYTVNRDGPCCFSHNNMRGARRRIEGEQFRFFVWDMEYSLWEATDDTNVEVDVSGAISHVYAQLRDNAEFRARYAARAELHLTGEGALTPTAAAARYQARADEIYAALLAEAARWGDTYRTVPYTRDVEWQAEYDRLMDEFFPARTELLIGQLEAAGLY